MNKRTMKRAIVTFVLASCMLMLSSCGSSGQEAKRGKDISKEEQEDQGTKSEKKKDSEKNKESEKGKESFDSELASGTSEAQPEEKKKSEPELIWYDGEYCTALCYKGEGAEKFISLVEGGALPFLSITSDGYFHIDKCKYSGDHLTFEYGSSGILHTGKCCENFKEEYYRAHSCPHSFEIRGEYGDGEVWFCVYNKANGPSLKADELPYVQISVYDPDRYEETSFTDSFGAKKQEYRTDVPERFLTKAVEIENLNSLADFPFADVSKAKTDDYMLHMSHETAIAMWSYDSDGKCVDRIDFHLNPQTGEVEEIHLGDGGDSKYFEICSYASSGSIQAYPSYFSKPYLTPQQFQSMYDK